jgi:hypothetical protein
MNSGTADEQSAGEEDKMQWVGIVVAFIIGCWTGIILMALLKSSRGSQEQQE